MKLTNLTKEQLIEEVKKLKARKNYGLVWEDKPEDVVDQCKQKLPVLEEVKDRAIISDEKLPTNLIIEGDNYHALSVLNYTHQGKIDVIYIDPPYNTGARDWKYNNDYVDKNDTYRHSKWLNFMYHRLVITKKLLKNDGVLIVTVDEHEVHNLGVLLRDLFPGVYMQMVTIVINPKGVTQGRFSRVEEYAIFCFFGENKVLSIGDDLLTPLTDEEDEPGKAPRWKGLLRSGTNAKREDRKNMFYPILIDEKKQKIIDAGESLPYPTKPDLNVKIGGYATVWPIRNDKSYGRWGVGNITFRNLIKKGYVQLGQYDSKRNTWGITYLSTHLQSQIDSGVLVITNHDTEKNVVDVRYSSFAERAIKTVWHRTSHDAGAYGTDLIRKILGTNTFTFPKSIYAVRDCLASICGNNKNALILDYFAGSGTTGHAVMLLNRKDDGNRRYILCTNNENKIAEEICYPRIKKTIEGVTGLEELTKFTSNVRYFKTGFVPKSRVSDDTRIGLVKKSTEMICVREDTFEKVLDNKEFKLYRNKNLVTGILFNLDKINDFKKELNKLALTSHIYVFSLTNDTYASDFENLEIKHKLCPIPESILEVYRKLFKE